MCEPHQSTLLCRICGRNPVPPRKRICPECSAEKKSCSRKKWLDNLKLLGLCTICIRAKAREGKAHCQLCADRLAGYVKRRKENHLCVCCGKRPPLEGVTRCSTCTEKYNTPRVRVEGVCTRCCKNPSRQGLLTCQKCSDRTNKDRERRAKKGQCLTCKNPAAKGFTQCAVCRAKRRELGKLADVEKLLVGRCFKHPERQVAQQSRRYCEECCDLRAKKLREQRLDLKARGLCAWCKKKKVLPGKTLCEKHHLLNVGHRKKAMSMQKLRRTVSEVRSVGEGYMEGGGEW